ncbi:MAG: hypothetical protein WBA12_14940, partial [Catalinimonas sp.]
MRRLLPFFLLSCLIGTSLRAQSSLRCRWVPTRAGAFQLDTLSLVPGTIHLQNVAAALDSVRYDLNGHRLQLAFPEQLPDTVMICYRVFPVRFDAPRFRRSLARYDSGYYATYERPVAVERHQQLFNTPGITKQGNLTRGVSFGNGQSVFVNSSLNLQMSGQLTDDLRLTAVISDQNVPFQPEGNTQQLQEFDRVYLALEHARGQLIAGDVVLRAPPSAFLRYYKNVQGGQATARYGVGKHSTAETQVSAAAAKGKFYSTPQLPVREGVLGPYRLRGPNGENLIILAGSEHVFLDGQLLTRGFNEDYVIDYNVGELTFTPHVVITQYTRVRVDFEYAERQYARTVLQASHRQEAGRVNFFMHHYQEGDNPRNPLGTELDTAARRLLSRVGDDPAAAVIDGSQAVEFTGDQVLYVRADTLV